MPDQDQARRLGNGTTANTDLERPVDVGVLARGAEIGLEGIRVGLIQTRQGPGL